MFLWTIKIDFYWFFKIRMIHVIKWKSHENYMKFIKGFHKYENRMIIAWFSHENCKFSSHGIHVLPFRMIFAWFSYVTAWKLCLSFPRCVNYLISKEYASHLIYIKKCSIFSASKMLDFSSLYESKLWTVLGICNTYRCNLKVFEMLMELIWSFILIKITTSRI